MKKEVRKYATNFREYWRMPFREKDLPKFAHDSDYAIDNFYLDLRLDDDASKEKIAELIKKVPERIPLENEKLEEIRLKIVSFVKEKGIYEEMINACKSPFLDEVNGFMFDSVDKLSEYKRTTFYKQYLGDYSKYIRETEIWKIAYYDFVQKEYEALLDEAENILHQKHLYDIKYV